MVASYTVDGVGGARTCVYAPPFCGGLVEVGVLFEDEAGDGVEEVDALRGICDDLLAWLSAFQASRARTGSLVDALDDVWSLFKD